MPNAHAHSSSVFVVVPARDEEHTLGDVLDDLERACSDASVVVVDDGSSDDTSRVAEYRPVHLLRHLTNLGQGAALKTGIDYALARGAEIIVTFDADGQMLADDVPRIVAPIASGDYDVALGTRFGSMAPVGMTRTRRFVLRAGLAFTRLTTRLPFTDTHNGFRAFSRKAAERIPFTQERMAHATEIAHDIVRLRLRWTEIPVTIRYTDYSKQKGQSIFGAADILWDLFWRTKR